MRYLLEGAIELEGVEGLLFEFKGFAIFELGNVFTEGVLGTAAGAGGGSAFELFSSVGIK